MSFVSQVIGLDCSFHLQQEDLSCHAVSSHLISNETSNFERNDSSVLTSTPQMTHVKREENGEIRPVNSAKKLKTANLTQTFNMYFQQSSYEEL